VGSFLMSISKPIMRVSRIISLIQLTGRGRNGQPKKQSGLG